MATVADATAERWDDLVTVFGVRGDASRCWCQWFRHQRPGFYATTPEQRRAGLQSQVAAPVPRTSKARPVVRLALPRHS
jgi:hypothetical protein